MATQKTDSELVYLPLDEIVVEGRHRRNLGDVAALAASIAEVGLLHPVVLDANKHLIAGGRRLAAFRLLERAVIPAYIVHDIGDVYALLRAEAAENTCRQPLLPSEAVSMAEALLPAAQEDAYRRMTHQPQGASVKLPEAGETMQQIANAVGLSRNTLSEARKIVAAARHEPEIYGDLVEAMDARGKVHGVYLELVRRQAEAAGLETQKPVPVFSIRMKKNGELSVLGGVGREDIIARLKQFVALLEAEPGAAAE